MLSYTDTGAAILTLRTAINRLLTTNAVHSGNITLAFSHGLAHSMQPRRRQGSPYSTNLFLRKHWRIARVWANRVDWACKDWVKMVGTYPDICVVFIASVNAVLEYVTSTPCQVTNIYFILLIRWEITFHSTVKCQVWFGSDQRWHSRW